MMAVTNITFPKIVTEIELHYFCISTKHRDLGYLCQIVRTGAGDPNGGRWPEPLLDSEHFSVEE